MTTSTLPQPAALEPALQSGGASRDLALADFSVRLNEVLGSVLLNEPQVKQMGEEHFPGGI